MDQTYSPFADWLSKFHTWPEPIQALWLIAVPATLIGITWLLMRGLRETIAATRHPQGRLLYGVYQDPQGHLILYRHGREPEVIARGGMPEPARDGAMTRGVSRREG
jgi:hypothetical protein